MSTSLWSTRPPPSTRLWASLYSTVLAFLVLLEKGHMVDLYSEFGVINMEVRKDL